MHATRLSAPLIACSHCHKFEARVISVECAGGTKTLTIRCAACGHDWTVAPTNEWASTDRLTLARPFKPDMM